MEDFSFFSDWFNKNESNFVDLAKDIFNHPELSHEEIYSSKKLSDFLEKENFQIKRGVSNQKTAFKATFGSGSPVLGFLAEYDALSGLGQKPTYVRNKIEGPGHGCGHNLLGTGVIAAACCLKDYMLKENVKGTIVVFGCPAEEDMSGKIIMNKQGLFDDLDVAITWHPFDKNRVSYDIWLSIDVKNYSFKGKAAHAAKFPEQGRSALDAAEIMNVGVNYLREHVPDDVRMHYSYISNDSPANIVPDYVKTNYFIRSGKRETTEDVSNRVDNCAKGSALMTGTKVEIELLSSCKEMKLNRTLSELYYKAMKKVEIPNYSEEEIDFAKKLMKESGFEVKSEMFGGLEPLEDKPSILFIGTDVSDVSHKVPTITLSGATMCKGTPLHHWSTTAQSGMSIGFKGMVYAAKSMAYGTKLLLDKPDILKAVWNEHGKLD